MQNENINALNPPKRTEPTHTGLSNRPPRDFLRNHQDKRLIIKYTANSTSAAKSTDKGCLIASIISIYFNVSPTSTSYLAPTYS